MSIWELSADLRYPLGMFQMSSPQNGIEKSHAGTPNKWLQRTYPHNSAVSESDRFRDEVPLLAHRVDIMVAISISTDHPSRTARTGRFGSQELTINLTDYGPDP